MRLTAHVALFLTLALAAPVALSTPAHAATESAVSCEDGKRDSAKAVADTNAYVESHDINNTNPNIDVVLRYSQTYECAWGLISGHDGDRIWVDRWIDGEPTWQAKRGDRGIRSGNGSTYTEAVRTGGAGVRACGQEKKGGTIECTSWVPKEPVGPGAGAPPQSANPGPASAGSTTPVGDDPFATSTDVLCAPGTTDAGVTDGWHQRTSVRIRLCTVDSLPSSGQEDGGHARVNSRISGAVAAMVKAAQNSRINLSTISSFRSMELQQSLCAQNKSCAQGNYATVAQPGTSNHQMGLALDFAGPTVKNPKAMSCSTRAAAPDNTAWVWLKDHASQFGFRQYAVESWHWDTLATANRC
jgi:hypothetical protein